VDDLAASLEHAADFAARPPLLPIVAQINHDLVVSVWGNFEASHDPDGHPWTPAKKPLSPANRKLLVLTGLLRREAVDAVAHAPLTDAGFTAQPPWVWYGDFHADGAGHLPQREFSGWGEEALDRAVDQVLDFTVRGLMEAR
jgi:hypothetical protein